MMGLFASAVALVIIKTVHPTQCDAHRAKRQVSEWYRSGILFNSWPPLHKQTTDHRGRYAWHVVTGHALYQKLYSPFVGEKVFRNVPPVLVFLWRGEGGVSKPAPLHLSSGSMLMVGAFGCEIRFSTALCFVLVWDYFGTAHTHTHWSTRLLWRWVLWWVFLVRSYLSHEKFAKAAVGWCVLLW